MAQDPPSSPFAGAGPRVFTMPPGAAFVGALARTLNEALTAGDDPFALADAIVLVPTRRAARALGEAFLTARGDRATLLPRIRALGDVDPDEAGLADLEPLDLPPAVDPLRRQVELAALVRAWMRAEGRQDDPVGAMAAADALGALLDSAALAGEPPDWSTLDALAAGADLAAHWQVTARFLHIVTQHWPDRLRELGALDPGEHRRRALSALTERWRAAPPVVPVVLAGSTGTVAATRALMAVVTMAPRGCVVLPGLDVSVLSHSAFARAAEDEQHPQHGLAATLAALGLPRDQVRLWPGLAAASAPRAALIHEALTPADDTADWLARIERTLGGADGVRAGLGGLALVEAATEEEEAEVAALALRRELETPGAAAALVTPSRALARRVSAKLRRWGVAVDVSAGRPLIDTPQGGLIRAALDWAADPADPVRLVSVLKQPLVTLGRPRAALAAAAEATERRFLRGVRVWDDADSLLAHVRARRDRHDMPLDHDGAAHALLTQAFAALAPVSAALAGGESLGAAAAGLARTLETLADPAALWAGDAGEEAAHLLRGLIDAGDALGPAQGAALAAIIVQRLAHAAVRPRGARPRVSIWGPLEARLQSVDLLVLGGLNEGVWPAPPAADPFLSRPMRAALGLPGVDARMGLQAHDFAQAACAPRVLLTRATRHDDAPATPSRWLWRLKTLVTGALGDADALAAPGAELLALARRPPPPISPAARPAPRPPLAARPQALPVTAVERLARDPYAVYAERVLGLRELDPLGAAPGPAQRGLALHEALADLVRDGGAASPDDLGSAVRGRLARRLRDQGWRPAQLDAEMARLQPAIAAFLAFEEARRARGLRPAAEVKGAIEVKGGPAALTLSARADRLDVGDGAAAIVDFKTGAPPSEKQMRAGLAYQLPVAAMIQAHGGFEGLPATPVSGISASYLRLGRTGAGETGAIAADAMPEAVAETARRLSEMVAHYADPSTAYPPMTRPRLTRDRSVYDHLARRAEWADADDDGESEA